MPTPDREALDARLRAVERALTDPDASLDPVDTPGTPRDPGPTGGDPGTGHAPAPTDGDPEPGTGSERRPERASVSSDGAGPDGAPCDGAGSADPSSENAESADPTSDTCPRTDSFAGATTGESAAAARDGELERRLRDLEAAIRALRGCLETRRGDSDDDHAADGPGVTVPRPADDTDPGGWPDDLAADGGRLDAPERG